jgi:regulator of protease activity HflC (stomatin/prohibitin superfamily)
VKITAVEVREIQPPRVIQEAMSRQMSAERNRRAVVLEADGTRLAAIAVAEGEKQAAILQAEGTRQATILQAEGTRQATILQAEGLANALQQIDTAAAGIGVNTMGLQYLDAFKTLSRSDSAKWIVPLEFTTLLRPFIGAPPADSGTAGGR